MRAGRWGPRNAKEKSMAEKFKNFGEYVEATRAEVARRFPEPEATTARRLLSGWRMMCERAGRSPDFPPEVVPTVEAAEDAKGWRERAWEAAKVAKDYGGTGSSFAVDELANAWLAMYGRGPNGRKFAEVAR